MSPRPSPGYPEARSRASGQAPGLPDRYARYESMSVALADTDAPVEVGRFSGVPDAIDLFAEGGAVTFILTDELGAEESTIRVPSGVMRETRIGRRVIRANRTTAGGTPTANAVAKWLG